MILLLAVASLLFGGTVHAGEALLPGSAAKIEDAVAKSDAIFVGKVSTLGFVHGSVPGQYDFGVTVPNLEGILGQAQDNFYGALVVLVVSIPAHEAPPKVDNEYIFCVIKKETPATGPTKYTALKLMPATDENITLVKKLAGK
jgi:hypothetical protein